MTITASARIASIISAAEEIEDVSAPPSGLIESDRDENGDEPTPLIRSVPPAAPFPVEALGGELKAVTLAIHEVVQAPLALCANSVIAAVTLAAQAHVDVELSFGNGTTRPTSMFFLTIAASGERKTTCDNIAMQAVKIREEELRDLYTAELRRFKDEHDAWAAERKEIIRTKEGLERRQALAALRDEPQPPLEPILTMAEPTIEGLVKLLKYGQPSVGVFSSEGGQFVGGHAMKDDAKLRSAGALSALWDGGSLKRVRVLDGTSVISGKRLAIHLQVQPEVGAAFANDAVLRDQGFLSRVLISAPATTMGSRFHREPSPWALTEIKEFEARLLQALRLPLPFGAENRNELEPRVLRLRDDAQAVLFEFANHVEGLLAPSGSLQPISGFAAKMGEQAARLAGVIAWWANHHAQEIDAAALQGGIWLARFYAEETLRLSHAAVVPPDIKNAETLRVWLVERWDYPVVSVPEICQRGPNVTRFARRARQLVKILVDHGWLTPMTGGAVIAGKRRREAWRIAGRA